MTSRDHTPAPLDALRRVPALLAAAVLGLILLASAGCGDKPPATTNDSTSPTASAAATGCAASGLDAMDALANFQLEMDAAQKAGKITLDQLTASRDKLFNQTQAASNKSDWAAYCKAIEDMRAELKI